MSGLGEGLYRPHESYLVHKLRGTQLDPEVKGAFDRMPLDGPPFLLDSDLHLIESWILQGGECPPPYE